MVADLIDFFLKLARRITTVLAKSTGKGLWTFIAAGQGDVGDAAAILAQQHRRLCQAQAAYGIAHGFTD